MTTTPRLPAITTSSGVAALGCTLAIWAHPDDETYLAGGLMATLRAAGRRVVVVTATRGEFGDDGRTAEQRAVLGTLRTTELAAALHTLGVGEHHLLDYADGGCSDVEPTGPVAQLRAIIDRVRPDTVLTFGPDGFTGHPDHVAVGEWAALACAQVPRPPRLWQPVVATGDRGRHHDVEERFGVFALGEPRECAEQELTVRLPLPPAILARKLAALRCHASQTTALIAAMGADRYADWVSVETYAARSAADRAHTHIPGSPADRAESAADP